MMTPEQRIEEIKLLLENLDYSDFSIQNSLDMLEILNKSEVTVGKLLRKLHSTCDNNKSKRREG